MSITPDIEAARRVLNALSNPNHKNTMKPTLDSHDRALAAVITAQNAAADAIGKRQTAAQAIVASFNASPSEAALAQAVAAQVEIGALNTIRDALPAGEHRERWLRDGYVVEHRDELVGLLAAELETRLKPRLQWVRGIASRIAKLSERLALREESATALAACSIEADALDDSIAGSSAAESAARRTLAILANSPTSVSLNDARETIKLLTF
jgi:hypothetical protein